MDARVRTGYVTGGLGYLKPAPHKPYNTMFEPPIDRAAAFTVTLARWCTATLKTRAAVEIRCLSGQLWITQLGDMRDTVLQAGQTHVLMHAIHDVVLSTVGSQLPATVEILPVGKARGALWQWLQPTRPHFQLEIA